METGWLQNILTIDVEDWYHANYSDEPHAVARGRSTVRRDVQHLLSILDDYQARATFFVLGSVAESDPNLIAQIVRRGHEIASHGYGHQLVYRQTRDEFKSDVRKSLELLRDISGTPVVGYRAPSWSFVRHCSWQFEELLECGIKYDSSVFPMKTFLYGDSSAPRFLNRIQLRDGRELLELPPTALQIYRKRFAFSGGFYLRVLPYPLMKLATKWVNLREKRPVVFYLHPREIDVDQPRLSLGRRDNFIHYVNVRSTEAKLRNLLKDFRVTCAMDYLTSEATLYPRKR